ncbi:hypothetical protein B0H14DRAFT_473963 [Mycena olivaceomarginata]|nr:hypothetical protein B0H14DRAFT_473963 [Mycena olivaceomarginata]
MPAPRGCPRYSPTRARPSILVDVEVPESSAEYRYLRRARDGHGDAGGDALGRGDEGCGAASRVGGSVEPMGLGARAVAGADSTGRVVLSVRLWQARARAEARGPRIDEALARKTEALRSSTAKLVRWRRRAENGPARTPAAQGVSGVCTSPLAGRGVTARTNQSGGWRKRGGWERKARATRARHLGEAGAGAILPRRFLGGDVPSETRAFGVDV